MVLLASWFTVQWYGETDSPVTWVQMAVAWWSAGYYWFRGAKEPEPTIELDLNRPLVDPGGHSRSEFK